MLKNLKKWFVVDDEEFKEKMSGDSAGDADIVSEQKDCKYMVVPEPRGTELFLSFTISV